MRILLITPSSTNALRMRAALVGQAGDWLIVDEDTLDDTLHTMLYDGVVLDGTTQVSPIALCQHIQQQSSAPLFVIIEGTHVDERVAFLRAGADDLIVPAMSLPEIAARLIAKLRPYRRPAMVHTAGRPIRSKRISQATPRIRRWAREGWSVSRAS